MNRMGEPAYSLRAESIRENGTLEDTGAIMGSPAVSGD